MNTTRTQTTFDRINQTRARQTPLPASRRFASQLKTTVQQGVGIASSVGNAVMGAALPAGGRISVGSEQGPLSNMAGSYASDGMELLALQQQIQMENQQYTTLSNVLKARHETNKSAISNLR